MNDLLRPVLLVAILRAMRGYGPGAVPVVARCGNREFDFARPAEFEARGYRISFHRRSTGESVSAAGLRSTATVSVAKPSFGRQAHSGQCSSVEAQP